MDSFIFFFSIANLCIPYNSSLSPLLPFAFALLRIAFPRTKMSSKPRTVYVTEKGCDLVTPFDDVNRIATALKEGYSWYDVMYPRNGTAAFQTMKPVNFVFTSEAELERQRAARAAKRAAAEERIRTAAVEAETHRIVGILRTWDDAARTFDAVTTLVAEKLHVCKSEYQDEILNKVYEIVEAENLLAPAPPPTPAPIVCEFPTSGPVCIEGLTYIPAFANATGEQFLLPILPITPTAIPLQPVHFYKKFVNLPAADFRFMYIGGTGHA